MTKLSKTYFAFRPGSRPAGRPASGRRPRLPLAGDRAAALVAARAVEVEGQHVGGTTVVRSRPSRGRRHRCRRSPRWSLPSPPGRRGRPVGPAARPPAAARGRRGRRDRADPRVASRSQGAEPTASVRTPNGAAPVVGPVAAGPVLLGALRLERRLGRRPRTTGRLLARDPPRPRRPVASSSWTATRMSRPKRSESASARTRRIRDSRTVCVNSLGAASTAVSSTSPSGRVRLSIAFCCGDRLVANRSRIWSQTVARSSVASAMPFFLPRAVDPRPLPVPPARPSGGPGCGSGLWTRFRTGSTPVSTGCARPMGRRAGPRAGSCVVPHVRRSARCSGGWTGGTAVG